jgi:hypothetical protein
MQGAAVATWAQFENEPPELAQAGRRLFAKDDIAFPGADAGRRRLSNSSENGSLRYVRQESRCQNHWSPSYPSGAAVQCPVAGRSAPVCGTMRS